MSAQTQGVYVPDTYSEPIAAQHNFANHFNLGDPHEAMSLYARIMHEHTKRQLTTATSSARRRSQDTISSSSNSTCTVSSTSS